jgi:hypothetical protein
MSTFRRYMLEEEFVQLAADAIQQQHPQAVWLAKHGKIGETGLTDRALEAAVERLRTWTATPSGQG